MTFGNPRELEKDFLLRFESICVFILQNLYLYLEFVYMNNWKAEHPCCDKPMIFELDIKSILYISSSVHSDNSF